MAGAITPERVRDFLSRLTAVGMSPRNLNKHRTLVAAIFAHGVRPLTLMAKWRIGDR